MRQRMIASYVSGFLTCSMLVGGLIQNIPMVVVAAVGTFTLTYVARRYDAS